MAHTRRFLALVNQAENMVLVAENQSVIKAFIADAAHPLFCDCIGLRRSYRTRANEPHAPRSALHT